MNRSYSKIRHIQNVNMLLESRRRNISEEASLVDENMLKQITNGYISAIMDNVNTGNMYDEEGRYVHREELTIDSLDEDIRLDAYLDVKEFVGMVNDSKYSNQINDIPLLERLGKVNNGFYILGQRFWDARTELLYDKSTNISSGGFYNVSYAFDGFGSYKKMLNDIVSEFEPAEVFVKGDNIFILTGDELKKHKEELKKSKTHNDDSDYSEEM